MTGSDRGLFKSSTQKDVYGRWRKTKIYSILDSSPQLRIELSAFVMKVCLGKHTYLVIQVNQIREICYYKSYTMKQYVIRIMYD